MTQPQQPVTVPPEGAPESELLAALIAALIAGAALTVIASILSRFGGIGSTALRITQDMGWASLTQQTADEFALLPRDDLPYTRILHQMSTQNAMQRAAYLVNAARRLAPAYGKRDENARARARFIEDRYRAAHEEAERKRSSSARQVAETASEFGVDARGEVLLGWEAVIDQRTSADCRWANGRNFDALNPPPIGLPGTVHLWCRCIAVPPYNTRKRVDRGKIPAHD